MEQLDFDVQKNLAPPKSIENYEKPKKEMEKFKQGYPSYHEKDINVGNSSKASIDEYRNFKESFKILNGLLPLR